MQIISLFKNISALTASQVLTAASNFFALAIVARMLGSSGYGDWTLYINAYAFGALALSFGLPPAINHYLAAQKLNREDLLGQLLFFALSTGVIFLAVAYLISHSALAPIVLPSLLPPKFIVLGLSVHFTILFYNQLLQALLLAEKQYRKVALTTALSAIILLLIYAAGYFWNQANAEFFFKYIILSNTAVLLLQASLYLMFAMRLRGYMFKIRFFSKTVFFMLLGFAGWVYVTNLLQFLNYKLDVWLITGFLNDKSKLGIYGLTVSLAQLLWLIPNAFHSIIFTETSQRDSALLTKKIHNWSLNIFYLAIIFGILGYKLSFWIVPIFFSQAYKEVTDVLPYLIPGIAIFAPSILWSAYFAGKKRIDINFKSSLIGLLFCILLNLILIPKFQIIGAAIATSCSYIASAVYLYWRFVKSV